MKYYLAYGSNLNLTQMFHRCPDAQVLGYTYLPGRHPGVPRFWVRELPHAGQRQRPGALRGVCHLRAG